MIRLTLLLLAGLFATLQIAGKDNGQMRFGLIEAEKEAALQAAAEPAAPAPVEDITQPVEVAFAPAPRVVAPTQEPVAAVAPPPEASPERLGEVRYVTGNSVNVRGGPSTRDGVVGRVTRGEEVTVVWLEDNGWARIRVEGDGIDGYMSADFLTDVAP